MVLSLLIMNLKIVICGYLENFLVYGLYGLW